MSPVRSVRLLAGAAAAILFAGTLGTAAAEAKPVRPGPVTGLDATVTPTGSSYRIDATWNAATSATKYRVSVTKSGTTLASATVTTTSWSPTVSPPAPGDATLSVTPVAVRRKGPTASRVVNLADVTAPSGTYASSWTNADATITQTSLTDNSPVGQVTRTVDWGDGGATEAWTTGTTLNHHYAALGRYVATVTLTDAANNTAVVTVPAIVIGDTTAPNGTFTTSPATGWATFTRVTVTQTSLGDDYSPQNQIARSVDWGDGTPASDWTTGTTLSHVYAAAGSFTPNVTITDEAHNPAQVVTSTVAVSVDSAAPALRLRLPKSHRHSVRAWKTLRAKATDTAGSGVKKVSLKAVEKRGSAWYGYRPGTKTWVKAGSKAKAFARSGALLMTLGTHHVWSGKLAALRKGTLVYRVKAVDNVGNASPVRAHKATLTQR